MRDILLFTDLGEVLAESIVKQILDYNDYDNDHERQYKHFTREPINILINSYGGGVYDSFAVINAMKYSKTPVNTICYSVAYSAAFAIFVAGDKRYCFDNCTFMYHDILVRHTVHRSLNYIDRVNDQFKNMIDIQNDMIVSRTKLTKKKLENILQNNSELYIGAKEALELDIVHEILK